MCIPIYTSKYNRQSAWCSLSLASSVSIRCSTHARDTMASYSEEGELQLFCEWFRRLSLTEKSWFLERLVPLVTPHKLFAQLERSSLGGAHTLPSSWEDCRDFQQRALFCAARVRSWSPSRANWFVNALEEIDQDAVYQFYSKISRAEQEP